MHESLARPFSRAAWVSIALLGGFTACARQGSVGAAGGVATPAPAEERATKPSITSGRDVVRLMRERYEGKWFRTLTFVQNNTRYKAAGGEDRSQWLEHYMAPGMLRIDYMPLATKSGVLYVKNHVYAFSNGKQISDQPQIHPLLLLGYDVYSLPVTTTIGLLDSLGINVDVVREDRWQDRPAYVIGAAAGDTTTNQFWIDAERLVLVRLLQKSVRGAQTTVAETRFDKYMDMSGIPVATEIMMLRDWKPFFKEEYTDVKLNVPIDETLFDPKLFATRPVTP
jgi:hypothetical protein